MWQNYSNAGSGEKLDLHVSITQIIFSVVQAGISTTEKIHNFIHTKIMMYVLLSLSLP